MLFKLLFKNNVACGSDVRSWRLNSCSQRRPFPAAVEMELALRRSGCSTSENPLKIAGTEKRWWWIGYKISFSMVHLVHLLGFHQPHLSNHGSHNFAGREPRRSRGASLLAVMRSVSRWTLVQWHVFCGKPPVFRYRSKGHWAPS